jgi:carbonic anhydrase/acetyltransferase-like protein (isoleucine patch superfamily)
LKRMIRRYTRAEYLERVRTLLARVPDLSLSTDIIVGFPGETEDDFALTLSLVREVGYRGLFGFKYSERPYTPARKLADDVPEAVKAERLARLFEVSEELLGGYLRSLDGSTQRVLVEGPGKEGKEGAPAWTGRTERNEIVHIAMADDLDILGDVVEVKITRANKHSLQGDLSLESRSRSRPRTVPVPGAPTRSSGSSKRSLPLVSAGGWAVALILPYGGVAPRLGRDVYVAPNATLIGDVELGDEASVWFGCVLRGDIGSIRVGARTNVQDLACMHLTDGVSITVIGADVTIGHGAILHGCTVGDRCLIGMGSILLDNAVIGEGSLVAAGSLVPPRFVAPPRSLIRGNPAKVLREVTEEEGRLGILGAEHYVERARQYRIIAG